MATFKGTGGDDNLDGTSGDDTFKLTQGGSDTANGEGGNDVFDMGATLDPTDRIDGGTGQNTVVLKGDYSAGLVLQADTIQNIETLKLLDGFDYNITLNDGNVAAGFPLTVNAELLGAGHSLIFDGSAELDGILTIIGGAGDDTITGGQFHNVFDLTKGGEDSVHGGNGIDTINFGTTYDAGDFIDGGAGNDLLWLHGKFTAPSLTLSAANIESIEAIKLGSASGLDTISIVGDLTSAGGMLLVNAEPLGDASVTFDLSAMTSTIELLLKAEDTIVFGGNYTSADRLNDVGTLDLNGDYSAGVTLGSFLFGEAATLKLGAGFSYAINTNDNTIGNAEVLTVETSTSGFLHFDGSAETNGYFHFIAGSGDDILSGGARADIFDMRAGGSDTVHGGGGADTFNFAGVFDAGDVVDGGAGSDRIYLRESLPIALTASNFISVEKIVFEARSDGDVTFSDGAVASGATETVDASALGSANHVSIDASADTDSHFVMLGGAGDDTLVGGQGGNVFTPGLGADTVTFGTSADTLVTKGAGDSTGAGHYDILSGFDAASDRFDLAGAHAVGFVNSIDATVDAGSFDADMTAATSGHIQSGWAVEVTVTGGDLTGHTYLVVDAGSDTAYQAGSDYVFDITGFSGTIATGDFI